MAGGSPRQRALAADVERTRHDGRARLRLTATHGDPVAPGAHQVHAVRAHVAEVAVAQGELHRPSDGSNRIVRQRTLQAIGLGAGSVLRLVDEDHDNVWFYGNGVDALFEPQVDSNVRVAVATALLKEGSPQPHFLDLRPKADGIVDFLQRNWNDWEGLGVDTCRTLRTAGAQVNCKPWPF